MAFTLLGQVLFGKVSSCRQTRSARRKLWRPWLESLEDRLVPAPVIEVFLSIGPNPVGPSAGYQGIAPATAPGFNVNSTTGLQANPPASIGNPTQTPSAFVPLTSGTRITSEQMIASTFPSWLGRANPGTEFGAAFADEQGSFVFYVVRIRESNPEANSFRLADLASTVTASNPTATAFFGPASQAAGWAGDLNTTDRIGFLANGTQVSGAGTGATFINELYFAGMAIANDASSFTGTDQQRLDQAVAQLRTLQDAPGQGFRLTVTHSLGGQSGNFSGAATVDIDTAEVNLSVVKTDNPDPVLAGQPLTYTINIGNSGPDNATNVTLTDTLPAGVTFVSATASQGTGCAQADGVVGCSLGTINNAGTANVSIVVQAPLTPGVISNTATATATEEDTNNGNNTSTVTTTVNPLVNLVVTKADAPDPVVVGQTLTYTISVGNTGPNNATGVVLTDTLPAGVTFVSANASQGTCTQASGTVTCDLGAVNNGGNATVTIVVQAPTTPGTISNTATATATETDSSTGNNTDTETTQVGVAVDLGVTKTDAPDPVLAGQSLVYTVTVSNSGPNNATGVVLTDTLPSGATFVSASASQGTCSAAGGTVTCNLGTINNGASAVVTISVNAPNTPGTIANTATVTVSDTDVNTGNNTVTQSTTVNANAQLAITKTDNPDPVQAGQTLTYTLTASNAGPNNAAGATVTDTLPSSVTLVSATSTLGTCTAAGGVVTCNLGTLATGASAVITIVVTPQAAGNIINSAAVSSSVGDSDTSNNTATSTTTVTPQPTPDVLPLTSPDRRFVAAIFRDLLKRPATDADIAAYGSLIEQGALTRVQFVQAIEASLEFRTVVTQQLFQDLLGRPADPGGLASFINFFAAGGTIEQAKAILLGSDEYFASQGGGTNAGFITAVYQDVLKRTPSADEIQQWVQLLDKGVSRMRAAAAILASPEADSVQTQLLFQDLLDRNAGPDDLAIYVNLFQGGATTEQVIAGITSSPEYFTLINGVIHQQWVAQVYRDVLNREAEPFGLSFWTGLLNSTVATPFQVAVSIQTSQEGLTVAVNELYVTYLHRQADPGGLESGINFLAQGGTREQLAAILTSSTEFFQANGGTNDGFLDDLYEDALGRPIDPSGEATYGQALANGAPRPTVSGAIFGSDEYRRHLVEGFYLDLLGRSADAAGLNAWVNFLAAGARDEQVVAGILSSPEYFTKL